MTIDEFILKFKEALDIDENILITEKSNLKDLNEWDSLGYISIMDMVDDIYGVTIEADNLKQCEIVDDIYRFIKNKQ